MWSPCAACCRIAMTVAPAALVLGPAVCAQADEVPSIAVVFGHHSYLDSPQGEGAGALSYMNTVRRALDSVGVRYAVVSDLTVETGVPARTLRERRRRLLEWCRRRLGWG